MNKMIIGLVAAGLAILTGCKTVPTVESMQKLGTASGVTAAYVLNNQAKVDDATRTAIIEVCNEVVKYIPATNETFNSTWTPLMKSLTDKYVKEGKLTEAQAKRVVTDFGYITTLLDTYVEKKGIKQYQELVDAFVHSFVDSFLKYFKPANTVAAAVAPAGVELDEFTYTFLTPIVK